MPRISKDDLIKKVSAYIGEDNSEEALSILEDISDSYDEVDVTEYENKISTLEKDIADLDASWRTRYRERFENKDATPTTQPEPEISIEDSVPSEEDVTPPSFEDIAAEF